MPAIARASSSWPKLPLFALPDLPDPTKLRWKKPTPQGSVDTIDLTATPNVFYSDTFGNTEDLLVTWSGTRLKGVRIDGARSVQFIPQPGARLDLTGSNTGLDSDQFGLKAKNIVDFAWFEGVIGDFTGSDEGDFINAGGNAIGDDPQTLVPDVYIQACRCTGMHGSSGDIHTDWFQAQHTINRLLIDKCTFESNYQGIFFNQQRTQRAAYLSRINGYSVAGMTGFLFYILADGSNLGDVLTARDVYIRDFYLNGNGGTKTSCAALMKPNSTEGWPIRNVSGKRHWDPILRCWGWVDDGIPPGGDFCTAAMLANYSPLGGNFFAPGVS